MEKRESGKIYIYTVHDSKAEVYLKPFFAKTRGEALRMYTEVANDKNTPMGKYPADFTLFEIGTYDEYNGQVEPTVVKTNLGLALDFLEGVKK